MPAYLLALLVLLFCNQAIAEDTLTQLWQKAYEQESTNPAAAYETYEQFKQRLNPEDLRHRALDERLERLWKRVARLRIYAETEFGAAESFEVSVDDVKRQAKNEVVFYIPVSPTETHKISIFYRHPWGGVFYNEFTKNFKAATEYIIKAKLKLNLAQRYALVTTGGYAGDFGKTDLGAVVASLEHSFPIGQNNSIDVAFRTPIEFGTTMMAGSDSTIDEKHNTVRLGLGFSGRWCLSLWNSGGGPLLSKYAFLMGVDMMLAMMFVRDHSGDWQAAFRIQPSLQAIFRIQGHYEIRIDGPGLSATMGSQPLKLLGTGGLGFAVRLPW